MVRRPAFPLALQFGNSRLLSIQTFTTLRSVSVRSVPKANTSSSPLGRFAARKKTFGTFHSPWSHYSSCQDEHNDVTRPPAGSAVESKTSNHSSAESCSVTPWYLQVDTLEQATESLSKRDWLPALPEKSPPLVQPILEYISIDLGLDTLSVLDLRKLDPPSGLGANLVMILATARSEKHLHVSADRFCRWLRSKHKISPFADGLMGRGELKMKLRRKARRAKLLSSVGSSESINIDDGLRTGWICVNVGTIESEESAQEVPEERENFVGFGGQVKGTKLVVQMMTGEKREELDLEQLWGNMLVRQEKREARLSTSLAESELSEEAGRNSSGSASTSSDGFCFAATSHPAISNHNCQQRRNFHLISRSGRSYDHGQHVDDSLDSQTSLSDCIGSTGQTQGGNASAQSPIQSQDPIGICVENISRPSLMPSIPAPNKVPLIPMKIHTGPSVDKAPPKETVVPALRQDWWPGFAIIKVPALKYEAARRQGIYLGRTRKYELFVQHVRRTIYCMERGHIERSVPVRFRVDLEIPEAAPDWHVAPIGPVIRDNDSSKNQSREPPAFSSSRPSMYERLKQSLRIGGTPGNIYAKVANSLLYITPGKENIFSPAPASTPVRNVEDLTEAPGINRPSRLEGSHAFLADPADPVLQSLRHLLEYLKNLPIEKARVALGQGADDFSSTDFLLSFYRIFPLLPAFGHWMCRWELLNRGIDIGHPNYTLKHLLSLFDEIRASGHEIPRALYSEVLEKMLPVTPPLETISQYGDLSSFYLDSIVQAVELLEEMNLRGYEIYTWDLMSKLYFFVASTPVQHPTDKEAPWLRDLALERLVLCMEKHGIAEEISTSETPAPK